MKRYLRLLALALSIAVLGPGCAFVTRTADVAAEEQTIRSLDEQWVATVAKKDAVATAAFYAPDGAVLPPNSPPVQGAQAITEFWQGLFQLPNLQLTFVPTQVVVAKAGDLAYDVGTYSLAFDGDQGPVSESGKYVVVWKKIDRHWKVAVDMFSGNEAAQ